MSMNTNLHGRLRNTSLPFTHGLLPLFEAVMNSIHAIEELDQPSSKGNITVEILRDDQQTLDLEDSKKKRGPEAVGNVVGFKITDNGVGFNEANMTSFLTLDTDYKASTGGRGIGRLLWLKAFQKVSITSLYQAENNGLRSRSFVFDANSGVKNVKDSPAAKSSRRSTTVHLEGFGTKYRDMAYKTTRAIANSIFEHCLWYFVRNGGAPDITVQDDSESIDLIDVYDEHMVSSAITEVLPIKGAEFTLTHIKLRTTSSQSHCIALCAAKRLVREENLAGKIPGLYGKLKDDTGDFVYTCYVTSPFLDDAVRPERTDFDILESTNGLFADSEISLQDIREAVIGKATDHLVDYLEENKKRAKERVEEFVAKKKPRYRPILSRILDDKLNVDPGISDRDLDITLHKHLNDVEEELLTEGHDIIAPKEGEELPEYRERLQEYLRKAADLKKSDLANYISHRRVILELLEKAIKKDDAGKYAREDIIHNLIMPMRTDSNGVEPDSCNLWLLDERLAFHDYLASDKTLASMPITGCEEGKEPDLCALNVFGNPVLVSEGNKLPLASIVVVEIKRPMRNDAKAGETDDPIEQALGYLDRIRKGNVHTASGRQIPNSADIPGFCYAICDITPSIKKRCEILNLTPTHDHLGYFGYNANYKVYLEVVSFDRLVNAAKERNRAFFDKLGLPTT